MSVHYPQPRLYLSVLRAIALALGVAATPWAHGETVPTGFQDYFVVGHEQHVWDMFNRVTTAESSATQANAMRSVVAVTASADNQLIYYDHWEDDGAGDAGYEADLFNPTQTSTLVFGDGNNANGRACDFSPNITCDGDPGDTDPSDDDIVGQGDTLTLNSDEGTAAGGCIATSAPSLPGGYPDPNLTGCVPMNTGVGGGRDPADFRFDGGDRIVGSGGPLVIIHAQEPEVPTAQGIIAGATEMLPEQALAAAKSYSIPVGEDSYAGNNTTTEPFKYVDLDLVAFRDGTSVLIENGLTSVSFTLDKGQHYSSRGFIEGSAAPSIQVREGTKVSTSEAIAGVLFTGGPGALATRFYTLLPDLLHGGDYITTAPEDADNNPSANLYIFNPDPLNPISVNITDALGTTPVNVPANASVNFIDAVGRNIAAGSGVRMTSNRNFWGITAYSHQSTAFDWGHSWLTSKFLTDTYTAPYSPDNRGNGNDSPLFVAALQDNTCVTIDFDNDGDFSDQLNGDGAGGTRPFAGTATCPNGYRVDSLSALRVFDNADNDNTGTRIVSDKPVAVAYGLDTDIADSGSPVLDLGYAVYPISQAFLNPVLTVDKSATTPTVPTAGGQVTYSLQVQAHDFGPLTLVSALDLLPPGATYEPGTTIITFPDLTTSNADPDTGTPGELHWDLDPSGAGTTTTLNPNENLTIEYTVNIPAGTTVVTNEARAQGNLGASVFSPSDTAQVQRTDVTLNKSVLDVNGGLVEAGDILRYTLVVTNNSTSVAEPDPVISDAIPAGTTFCDSGIDVACNDITDTGVFAGTGAFSAAQNAVIWDATGSSLAANGGTATLTFDVKVDPAVAAGSVLENAASFESGTTATFPSNTVQSTVVGPDLVFTKDAVGAPAIVQPGNTVTYRIRVENTGDGSADNLLVEDPFPSNATYVPGSMSFNLNAGVSQAVTDAADADQGTALSDRVRFTLLQLGPGEDATFLFKVAVNAGTAGQNLNNQATVSSDESIPRDTNLLQIPIQDPAISGHLFLDVDNNGIQDAGEPDLPDIDVIVTEFGGGSQTVSTDANGDYLVVSVPNGITTVNVDETDPDFPSATVLCSGAAAPLCTDPQTFNFTGTPVSTDPVGYVPPALVVNKSSSAPLDGVAPGDTLTYSITVNNLSSVTHTGITVTDNLPPGTSYVPGSTNVTNPDPGIRVTEYFIDTGAFTGSTYDLTLNQDLRSDYFVIIQGSGGDGSAANDRGPDEDYAALTADPFGTGDLATSGATDRITLTRHAASDDWVGVVTVVESMPNAGSNGFSLLDVQRVVHSGDTTSGSDTSGVPWTSPAQVMLMGGFNGAGCDTTETDPANHNVCHVRLFPSGGDVINWTRDNTPGALSDATSTVMVLQWGSAWTVQETQVTGGNNGEGADQVGEYNTAALGNAVNRANTWVWGTGHTDANGLEDAAEGVLITLGDGVNRNAVENTVAAGFEDASGGTATLDFEVWALTHPDLDVQYLFKPDRDTTALTVDTLTRVSGSQRMALAYNGSGGNGTAYPRSLFSARFLDTVTVTSQVSQSSDDAEERVSNGNMRLTSSDLELIRDGGNDQLVGVRFREVQVPRNAAIVAAYLDFTVDETGNTATTLNIAGQAIDDAPTFSGTNSDISGRGPTGATVSWNGIPAWNTVGQVQSTPNLAPVVQEIVNRGGWNPGQAMAFIITGSGTRTAESFDGTAAPRLRIEYLPATAATTLTAYAQVDVAQGSDDAEERVSNGNMSLTSSDLELIRDGGNDQLVGIRFQGLAIPPGATITSAYLDFTVDETGNIATSVAIQAEATDSAGTFTGTNSNISTRPRTTASVPWNGIPPWNTVGETQTSPDISSVLQELVDRPGWTSGNDLAIIVTGSGRRTAESVDGTAAAVLRVTYEGGTIRMQRRRSGQPFPAWIQAIDFSGLQSSSAPASGGAPPNLTVAGDGYELPPGQSMTVTFQVQVDNPLAGGITDIANLAQAHSNEDATDRSAGVTDPVIRPAVDVEPDGAGTLPDSVSDQTLLFQHSITNTGDVNDSYAISATSGQGWKLELLDPSSGVVIATDSDGDGAWDGGVIPNTGTLAAGGVSIYRIRVTVPGGTSAGSVDTLAFAATSDRGNGVTASALDEISVIDSTAAGAADVLLNPDHSGVAVAGQSVAYTHVLTNLTGTTETFDLNADSSAGYAVTFYRDGNGDGLYTPGVDTAISNSKALTNGESQTLFVVITVDVGANIGDIDLTTLSATAMSDPAVGAVASDTTTVTGGATLGMDLSGGGSHVVKGGDIDEFPGTLSNTGDTDDRYRLTLSESQYSAGGTTPDGLSHPSELWTDSDGNGSIDLLLAVDSDGDGNWDQVNYTGTGLQPFNPSPPASTYDSDADGEPDVPVTAGGGLAYRLDRGVDPTQGPYRDPVTLTAASLLDPAQTDSITATTAVLAATRASIASFDAYALGGRVLVEWRTTSEIGTIGFFLERLDPGTERFQRITPRLLPGLLQYPRGGTYRFLDRGARFGEPLAYRLVEMEATGRRLIHGPYRPTLRRPLLAMARAMSRMQEGATDYERMARPVAQAALARLKARQSSRSAARQGKARRQGHTLKAGVTESGLYYLDQGALAIPMGLNEREVHDLIRKTRLALSQSGQGVDWLPAANQQGIYFFSEALNSQYSDEQVVWLAQDKGRKMRTKGAGKPKPAPGQWFTDTVEAEESFLPIPHLTQDPDSDYWMWGFVMPEFGVDSQGFTLSTPAALQGGEARLTVHLFGGNATPAPEDHHALISVNGTPVGETGWDGTQAHSVTLTFDSGLLHDGDNQVEVTGIRNPDVFFSLFYINRFQLSYPRAYRAHANHLLAPGQAYKSLSIEGFNTADILVFDVTDPMHPVFLKKPAVDEPSPGAWRVSFKSIPEHRYLAVAAGAAGNPSSLVADLPSSLKQADNAADYLVITSSDLIGAAQALADYRSSRDPQLKTLVVDIEDIYDEFSHGVMDPDAIWAFLSYAYHNWQTPPAYVVLAGDGSYDYRDYLGQGEAIVPALMTPTPDGLYASDNLYADVAGNDGVPEMAIGRIPVISSDELLAFVDKLRAYETSGGAWESKAILAADATDLGGDFAAESEALAPLFPIAYTLDKIYVDDDGSVDPGRLSPADSRAAFVAGINDGRAFVNFFGHGDFHGLGNADLLDQDDLSVLSNADRLPVMTAMTCLTGQFSLPGAEAVGEALLLKPDGGVIAVWAPSGLSLNDRAGLLDSGFYRATFEDGERIIGKAIVRAQTRYAEDGIDRYLLDIFNLLGDPATVMK